MSLPKVPSRFLRPLRNAALLAIVLSFVAGCHRTAKPAVTITFLDTEWPSENRQNRSKLIPAALEEFTRQTGIQVTHLPTPEDSLDQLALTSRLLEQGVAGPDVYAIDMVWPGALQQYFVDLTPSFGQSVKDEDPELLANYTVHGRLVATPYHTNVGVLWYRTDLLKKYGFRAPPKTWDELENMAARIQAGERAAGNRNFWGFVWPGAANETLTCNALEWQIAEGGGHIVEPDGRITVNNPSAIHAWQRAAHWIGWISPPAVLSYREWDSINTFKRAQNSAFLRGWASDYFVSIPFDAPVNSKAGETSLPGPAILGGTGLAVSKQSPHQAEALQLVRFLLQREQRLDQERARNKPAGGPLLYNLPAILKAYSASSAAPGAVPGQVALRPSTVTGKDYNKVGEAYSKAVYSVLSKSSKAEEAASRLQDELSRMNLSARQ